MWERCGEARRALTDALGLEAAPGEVGQAGAGDGALEEVALPAAEVHRAADLEGDQTSQATRHEDSLERRPSQTWAGALKEQRKDQNVIVSRH